MFRKASSSFTRDSERMGLIVLTTHPAVPNKQRKLYRIIGLLLMAIGSLALVRLIFSGGS